MWGLVTLAGAVEGASSYNSFTHNARRRTWSALKGDCTVPLPLSVLLPAATGVLGWFFQQNSARNEHRRQWRATEVNGATKIYNEMNDAMDVLRYHLRENALFVARRKGLNDQTRVEEDGRNWQAFEHAVFDWKTHKTRFATGVQGYFGDENIRVFKAIDAEITRAITIVNATYYNGMYSVLKGINSESERAGHVIDAAHDHGIYDSGTDWVLGGDELSTNLKINEYFEIIKDIEEKSSHLSKQMMSDLRHENVGGLRTLQSPVAP